MNRAHAQARDREQKREGEGGFRPEVSAFVTPPAKLSLLYESADGRLCLFEDALGHLSAVRASRLA